MMIREFLNYLQFERNYSARTVKEYGADLKEFELYFKIWMLISHGSRSTLMSSATGWRV